MKNFTKQLSVLADLGLKATSGVSTNDMMEEICKQISNIFNIKYIRIFKRKSLDQLTNKVAIGWNADQSSSQAKFALLQDRTIVSNINSEKKFETNIYKVLKIRYGISILIRSNHRVWGILEIHSTKSIGFPKHFIDFLQSIVNILEQVLDRDQRLKDLNESIKNLEKAYDIKNQFLSLISHELRTPLTPVVALVSVMLSNTELNNEQREMISSISTNLQREMKLIDDLLDVLRISTGNLDCQFEVVDVHEVLNEAISICDFKTSSINFNKNLDATNTIMIADRGRLVQVFWNIIDNAIKFMPGGGDVSIQSQNREANNKVFFLVSFRDKGIGIANESKKSIFDFFWQVDSRLERRFGGLGLGLPISKSIVESHGGAILAHSEGLGKGAIFTVELPLIEQIMHKNITNHINPIRLFYVEDDKQIANTYKMLFKTTGFEVTHSPNVKTALELASIDDFDFDLILSDIALPDGTGWEIMQYIRSRNRDIPGVAISGYGSPDDFIRSQEAGFNEHLVKPVLFPCLLEILSGLIRNKP